MTIEERMGKIEEKVYMIIGGIVVLAALSTILFMIANVKFQKEENFEQDFLNMVKKHSLKGESGPSGRDGISVPIGGIVAWPALLPDKGDSWYQQWRVCNGDEIPLSEVSNEFKTILRDIYGKAKPGYIKLPDYKGYFLRGLDDTGKVDPDRKDKKIGSFQTDELKKHSHPISGKKANKANGGTYGVHVYYAEIGAGTLPTGGNETRPKNTAVYWIIRIR